MRTRFHGQLSLSIVWGLLIVGLAASDTDRRLVDAVKKSDTAAIRLLLKEKIDVNAPQPDGDTALHWAAYKDDAEIVDLLITRGARVNAENDYGATPLWVACYSGNAALVQRLLAAGADPNKGLRTGETVLMRCAWTGDAAAVEALVAGGADIQAREPSTGQTALMWGVANRHSDVTRVLLAHGSAVGARTAVTRKFSSTDNEATGGTEFYASGFTPLLFAARNNDIESARLLLNAGAKVDDMAADGNTPLVLAAMSGHGQFATFMLDSGADANAAGAGYSALHAAVLRGNLALVMKLLAKGANPNAQLLQGTPVPRHSYQFVFSAADLGATPFALAAKYVEPEILRSLASAGADPLPRMKDGRTPLMAAVGVGARRPYSSDRRGRRIAPELIAAEWQNEARVLDVVKAILEVSRTMDVNQATSVSGDTALHGAASNGYEQVLEFLVAHGGELTIANKAGRTPRELLSPSTADSGPR